MIYQNKHNYFSLLSITLSLFMSISCTSTPTERQDYPIKQLNESTIGMRLAVLQPNGFDLPENQKYFLSVLQSSLTSDFDKYSKMTVLDRPYLDDILKEQNLSMNGDFSDDDYIRIGHLANAQYILVGSLRKITTNNFLLDLAITNPETGERLVSFGPKQYVLSEIQGMVAAKDAAYELLLQIGIGFNETMKKSLYGTTQASVSAETALAKGIISENRGATFVEVMQYYYQAVDYDSRMTEAIDRLATTNSRLTSLSQPLTIVRTGNIREDALAEIAAYRIEQENKRIDEENKKTWIAQLTDCENYFSNFFKTAYAPLELVYSTDIRPFGNIDKVNETMSLMFQATLLPSETSWPNAAEKTIAAIRKALIETGRAEAWGLSDWPQKSILLQTPFSDRRISYNIKAQLLDENDMIIGFSDFTLSGGWNCVFSAQQSVAFTPYIDGVFQDVIFSGVKISRISDILSIRIDQINGVPTEIAAESGMFSITPNTDRVRQAFAESGARTRAEAKAQNDRARQAVAEAEARARAEAKAQSDRARRAEARARMDRSKEYFSNLWGNRWFGFRLFGFLDFWGSDSSHKIKIDEDSDSEPTALSLGIETGIELGLSHLYISGHLFGYIFEGFGGDFSMGYAIVLDSVRGGVSVISTIGPGLLITPIDEFKFVPYIQVYLARVYGLSLRLLLPIIDGEVKPGFRLGVGFGGAWKASQLNQTRFRGARY
jgi:hypothetical protein